MAELNKTDLKAIFKEGAVPTEAQFASLIDSQINTVDTSSQANIGSSGLVESSVLSPAQGFFNLRSTQPFIGLVTTKPTTGSGMSLHAGLINNVGQPYPNNPFIKTNGGFDIFMDNADQGPLGDDTQTEPLFRVYRGTAIAGIPPGVELLRLSQQNGLRLSGSLTASGAISASGALTVGALTANGAVDLNTTTLDIDASGAITIDGAGISLDSTTTLNIDNSNTSNGITIGTATSGVPISIGHATSETTVNDNLTVTGTTTFTGAQVGQKLTIINVDDNVDLTAAESGKLCIFSDADGAIVRLPDSGDGSLVGVYYDFYITVAATSNNHVVACLDPTNEDIEGYLHSIDADNASAFSTVAFRALNSDGFGAITMNGTTTGTVGTSFRITNIKDDRWYVTGHIAATGVPATPFN